MSPLLTLAPIALTLATMVPALPAEAAKVRATGIMLTYKATNGVTKPALFSLPGHDMPMAECRRVFREQTQLFRAQIRNDEDFTGLRYVTSKCVYLDTDPLGLEN